MNKVAVEMNLSESCFVELKPESVGQGETVSCVCRALRYYSSMVGASQSNLKKTQK